MSVAAAAIAAGAIVWGVRMMHWPIEVVRIDSAVVHTDRERLQEKVTPYARAGFFELDLAALRDALIELPWVRDARLRRVWPNRLRVAVVEHEVAATWNDRALLSRDGVVFSPQRISGFEVPALQGPDGQGAAMLERLRAFEAALSAIEPEVRALTQDERRAWRLRLDNGVRLRLGRDGVAARLKRFAAVWPRTLHRHADAVSAVDLRYPNGLAVSWRDEAPEGATAAVAHEGANDV
ncbi:MAG: cell division protein FtsQ [Proteobacteria bacterium SW_6_67_9]|nr:MAG: cell division protein FtsQ [Proteobacteria bacterium SW_6_67_9]